MILITSIDHLMVKGFGEQKVEMANFLEKKSLEAKNAGDSPVFGETKGFDEQPPNPL